jgi:hypothetical protein
MRTLEHPQSLIEAAKQAGISVPEEHNYDTRKYPHWHFFVNIQIGRPLKNDQSHFKNAVVIASVKDLSHLSFLDLEDRLE